MKWDKKEEQGKGWKQKISSSVYPFVEDKEVNPFWLNF